jgi:hypothetical protein
MRTRNVLSILLAAQTANRRKQTGSQLARYPFVHTLESGFSHFRPSLAIVPSPL